MFLLKDGRVFWVEKKRDSDGNLIATWKEDLKDNWRMEKWQKKISIRYGDDVRVFLKD